MGKGSTCRSKTACDVYVALTQEYVASRLVYPKVTVLGLILETLPVVITTAERSFLILKRRAVLKQICVQERATTVQFCFVS